MSDAQLPLDHASSQPRRVAESQMVLSQQMNPEDANPSGDVHGGTIMKLVDTVHTSSAYLVFVALDDAGKPTRVPPLIVESDDELRRQAHAKIRRESRKARQEAIKKTMDPGHIA